MKARLDELLVAQGLAPDLAKARGLIMAGQVVVGERRADKPGERPDPALPLRLKGQKPHPFVSRGGLKLEHALTTHALDVRGWVAVDLGASTGGFTDCLLQRGTKRVYSVDVGYGLLDYRLRQDPRVVLLERTHAKDLDATKIPEPVDLLVADISFNSLTRLLPAALLHLSPCNHLILLVKPQFELEIGATEGGIVRDPALREQACLMVEETAKSLGYERVGLTPSPIEGADGNVEYLLWARRRSVLIQDRDSLE